MPRGRSPFRRRIRRQHAEHPKTRRARLRRLRAIDRLAAEALSVGRQVASGSMDFMSMDPSPAMIGRALGTLPRLRFPDAAAFAGLATCMQQAQQRAQQRYLGFPVVEIEPGATAEVEHTPFVSGTSTGPEYSTREGGSFHVTRITCGDRCIFDSPMPPGMTYGNAVQQHQAAVSHARAELDHRIEEAKVAACLGYLATRDLSWLGHDHPMLNKSPHELDLIAAEMAGPTPEPPRLRVRKGEPIRIRVVNTGDTPLTFAAVLPTWIEADDDHPPAGPCGSVWP